MYNNTSTKCYINSIIQIYLNLEPLTDFLRTNKNQILSIRKLPINFENDLENQINDFEKANIQINLLQY